MPKTVLLLVGIRNLPPLPNGQHELERVRLRTVRRSSLRLAEM
jgi:hypothetical protein